MSNIENQMENSTTQDALSRGFDSLAWLASSENKDEDMRKNAKEVLDKLFFLTYRLSK